MLLNVSSLLLLTSGSFFGQVPHRYGGGAISDDFSTTDRCHGFDTSERRDDGLLEGVSDVAITISSRTSDVIIHDDHHDDRVIVHADRHVQVVERKIQMGSGSYSEFYHKEIEEYEWSDQFR